MNDQSALLPPIAPLGCAHPDHAVLPGRYAKSLLGGVVWVMHTPPLALASVVSGCARVAVVPCLDSYRKTPQALGASSDPSPTAGHKIPIAIDTNRKSGKSIRDSIEAVLQDPDSRARFPSALWCRSRACVEQNLSLFLLHIAVFGG